MKHFISVLGTGPYSDAKYMCDGEGVLTPFIQEAVLALKIKELEQGDRVTIFVTKESMACNWEDRPYSDRERKIAEADARDLPEIREGLRAKLKRKYEPFMDENSVSLIPIGADEKQMWEIFRCINETLSEGEELYIDITHALRHIPILMLAVATFARVVKNIKIAGIYYGAFETAAVNEEGIKEAPIYDLLPFVDMIDWAQAVNSFIKYGNSDQIRELYNMKKRTIPYKANELNKVLIELQNITHGLETSRGFMDEKATNISSIRKAYQEYKTAYELMVDMDNRPKNIEKQQKDAIQPLGELFHVINEAVSVFDVNSNLELGIEAIRWAIDKKKTQQGFTALEETVKTFLCNYYEINESKEKYRDGLVKSICNSLNYMYEKEWTVEMREACFAKWNERHETLLADEPELLDKAHRIMLDVPQKLVTLLANISDSRNSINHFGYSNKNKACTELDKSLKVYFDTFCQCMQEMNEGKNERR